MKKYACHSLLHLEFEMDVEQAETVQQEYETFLKIVIQTTCICTSHFWIFFNNLAFVLQLVS